MQFFDYTRTWSAQQNALKKLALEAANAAARSGEAGKRLSAKYRKDLATPWTPEAVQAVFENAIKNERKKDKAGNTNAAAAVPASAGNPPAAVVSDAAPTPAAVISKCCQLAGHMTSHTCHCFGSLV